MWRASCVATALFAAWCGCRASWEEDTKRTHRERKRLIKERVGHVNRIKGLLATPGIQDDHPMKTGRHDALAELRCRDGRALPPALSREISREFERLELVLHQPGQMEGERDAVAAAGRSKDPMAGAIGLLAPLGGIGTASATVLVREVFYRDFEYRGQLAIHAGLMPTTFMSGAVSREQSIGKAGNLRPLYPVFPVKPEPSSDLIVVEKKHRPDSEQLIPRSSSMSALARRARRCATKPSRANSISSIVLKKPAAPIMLQQASNATLPARTFSPSQ